MMEDDFRQLSMEEIRSRLNQCGLKATPQRIRVYAAMCRLGHASADTVYHQLGAAKGTMSLATVYNVLESMTESGLLVRRPSFSSKMFFDVDTSEHGHLYRSDTQELVDIPDESLLPSVEARVRESLPESLVLDRVEIQVVCHAGRPAITK
jgi:Fe2+ or Zn2+ uptake regulation protein